MYIKFITRFLFLLLLIAEKHMDFLKNFYIYEIYYENGDIIII